MIDQWPFFLLGFANLGLLFAVLYLVKSKKTPSLGKEIFQAPVQTDAPYCTTHRHLTAKGTCAICSEYKCTDCLKIHKSLNFCLEHFNLFTSTNWDEAVIIKTDSEDTELGPKLYKFKEDLWKNKMLASYIQTHYKINFESDNIETFVSLYCKKEDVAQIKGLYGPQFS